MNKKRIIIVCPGRGSYTRESSGYLKKYGKLISEHVMWMDKMRERENLLSLTLLDDKPFQSKTHMTGENASTLIFACSLSDFSFTNSLCYFWAWLFIRITISIGLSRKYRGMDSRFRGNDRLLDFSVSVLRTSTRECAYLINTTRCVTCESPTFVRTR